MEDAIADPARGRRLAGRTPCRRPRIMSNNPQSPATSGPVAQPDPAPAAPPVDRSEIGLLAAAVNDAVALAVVLAGHLSAAQIGALEAFAASGTALAAFWLLHRRDKAA